MILMQENWAKRISKNKTIKKFLEYNAVYMIVDNYITLVEYINKFVLKKDLFLYLCFYD